MKNGTELVLDERRRQITKEGYTSRRDDRHSQQELQRAAEAYFLSAEMYRQGFKSFRPPDSWPWSKKSWKPTKPIRDLTKAGALWMAEFDRLKRLGGVPKGILNNLRNQVQECVIRIDKLLAMKGSN